VLKKLVNVLEVVALVAAGFTVVMLFAGGGGDEQVATDDTADAEGAALFSASCAGCHGADGGGGVGPQLSDGAVLEAFPDEGDEIAVVTDGRGGMPAFGDRLSAEEIAAVVAFTRTTLAGEAAEGSEGTVAEQTTTTAEPTTTTEAAPQYDDDEDRQDEYP
jgi:mono/diheme cytochrome c family protein